MEIPAPLPGRPAARRRKAHARKPRGQKRDGEADTTPPGRRWNLISAPLLESVVVRKPLSRFNITRFREMRQCELGSEARARAGSLESPAEAAQPASVQR